MIDFEGKTPEQLAHMLEESITQLLTTPPRPITEHEAKWAITKACGWDEAFDFYEHFRFVYDEGLRKMTLTAKTALGLRMLNPPLKHELIVTITLPP